MRIERTAISLHLTEQLPPSQRVVVTGLGIVTALGPDLTTTWQEMREGKTGIRPIDIPNTRIKVAAVLSEGMEEDIAAGVAARLAMNPTRLKKRYHPAHVNALKVILEAADDADLLASDTRFRQNIVPEDTGLVVASCLSGAGSIAQLQEKLKEGRRLFPSDLLVAEPERAAAVGALAFGIKGPNFLVNSACASGNLAVIEGIEKIVLGDATMMLAVGTESCIDEDGLLLSLFENTGAVYLGENPERACRPFDIERRGFVPGVGAGCMILESLEHARTRGLSDEQIYGELLGWAITNDAFDPVQPSGEGIDRAMRLALERAFKRGLTREELRSGYLSAHGTGTDIGDVREAEAIQRVFEYYDLNDGWYVGSTKGYTGHPFGASTIIEGVFCFKGMNEGRWPATLGLETPLSEAEGLNLVRQGDFLEANVSTFINSGSGFGGFNTVVVGRQFSGY